MALSNPFDSIVITLITIAFYLNKYQKVAKILIKNIPSKNILLTNAVHTIRLIKLDLNRNI